MYKEAFKRYVELEFIYRNIEGSFVVLRRDQVKSLIFIIKPVVNVKYTRQSDQLVSTLESVRQ